MYIKGLVEMIKNWAFSIIVLLIYQSIEAQEINNQNQLQIESSSNPSSVDISPFQFVIDEKDVQIDSPQIKYLLQNDSIQVGRLNINKNDFKIVHKKASNLQISNEANVSDQENTEILEVELTSTNIDLTSFEILDKTGQRIYQSSIQQGKMSFIDPKKSMTSIFQSETFFRLCFISSSENDELRICSSNMTFDKESLDFKLTQQNEQAKNRIYFNNNEITELNSSFTPSTTDKLSIHFENKAGLTLTYTGQLPLLNFTEFTRSLDKLNITGIGLRPLEINIKEIKNEVHPMMQQTYNQKFYFENPETWFGEIQFQDHVNFHFQKGVYSIFTTKVSFTYLPFDKDKPAVKYNPTH